MGTCKNLIIVAGPFQLLNAIETINKFNLSNVLLIVFTNSIKKSNQQIQNYIDTYSTLFKSVKWIKFTSTFKKYYEYRSFLLDLKKSHFDYIGLASLNKVTKLILTKTYYNKVILFDDGLETIHTAKILSSKLKLVSSKYFFLGMNTKLNKEVIFFSILNLKDIDVIKNNMTFISGTKDKSVENKVDFIGQDFVRTEYVSEKTYFEVLDYISIKYKDYKIEYFPHRGEEEDLLLKINKRYNNIEIVKLDITYEMYLATQSTLPYKVISCWSTVLITINKIFKQIKTEAIFISRSEILKNNDKIMPTYDYFKKENITVIDIKKGVNNVK
ncbi:MAG TPA: hypothetical protein EYG97_02610 [Arcobacter sp.]|nr:hypothetical protein [Arcobacter sp.]